MDVDTTATQADEDYAGDPPAAPERTSDLAYGPHQGIVMLGALLVSLIAAVLAVVALVVAINADGDGGAGGAAPVAAGDDVTLVATEFAFDPAVFATSASATITLDNQGSVAHNIEILQSGTTISSEDEFSADLSIGIVEAEAGQSATQSFTLEPGTYQFICSIPGHFSAGMSGEMTVS